MLIQPLKIVFNSDIAIRTVFFSKVLYAGENLYGTTPFGHFRTPIRLVAFIEKSLTNPISSRNSSKKVPFSTELIDDAKLRLTKVANNRSI